MKNQLLKLSKDVQDYYQQNKPNILRRVPGHIKLLSEPRIYALGAIESLQRQLESVRSPKRRARLEKKLSAWTIFVERLEKEKEKENVKETATESESGTNP